MPQLLRRRNAPIDWNIESVANHPILSSGVGACILAYAQAEATMGIFLAHIRWKEPEKAVQCWVKERTTKGKLALVEREAMLAGLGQLRMAKVVLDSFVALAKRRASIAHGVFGIITDQINRFAWRSCGTPAIALAAGLSGPFGPPVQQKTLIYTPDDFADLAQDCANVCRDIDYAISGLVVFNAFSDA